MAHSFSESSQRCHFSSPLINPKGIDPATHKVTLYFMGQVVIQEEGNDAARVHDLLYEVKLRGGLRIYGEILKDSLFMCIYSLDATDDFKL